MNYRRLGASGLEVSPICLGMMSYGSRNYQSWVLPPAEGERFFGLAIDRGINFFDTAALYSSGLSEEILGDAVAKLSKRHHVVISTKVGPSVEKGPNQHGLSRTHILNSIDASLRRLKTDYVDIYLMQAEDHNTPLEESLDAMHHVVAAGKARYVGLSNFSAWNFARAFYTAKHSHGLRLSTAQLQYNLAYREDERDAIPFCCEEGIGITTYSPLARGWLAGDRLDLNPLSAREAARAKGDLKAQATYNSGLDRKVAQRLFEIAKNRGVPPSRIAIAWILSKPYVHSVTCGITEVSHLDEAVAATELTLSNEEIAQLEEVYEPRPPMSIDVPIRAGGGRVAR